MGTRLCIKCNDKETDDCGKFYGYCNYEDAKESFDFLVNLVKQNKVKFIYDEVPNIIVLDLEYNEINSEIFYDFTIGSNFGYFSLSNEDYIKFIELHNKEAWKFWNHDNNDKFEDWDFNKQCQELSKLPENKYLYWG